MLGHYLRSRQRLENPPPEVCLEVGEKYLAAPDQSGTSKARDLYRRYAAWTQRLFELILIKVDFTEADPYKTSDEMRRSILETRTMRVFSGGEAILLKHDENLRGRAVHDLLAHVVCGCPFTATGEFNAFEAQAALYPVDVRPVLFCEIVGQTCAYVARGGAQPEQKVVWFTDEEEEKAGSSMRRQFKHGLGLSGAVLADLVDTEIFKVAEETGYAHRYQYAVLETQSKKTIDTLAAENPRRKKCLTRT